MPMNYKNFIKNAQRMCLYHHHNRFTALFPGPPKWATPSRLTSANLHHPPIFTGRMLFFLPPNQQCQSMKDVPIIGDYIPWKAKNDHWGSVLIPLHRWRWTVKFRSSKPNLTLIGGLCNPCGAKNYKSDQLRNILWLTIITPPSIREKFGLQEWTYEISPLSVHIVTPAR